MSEVKLGEVISDDKQRDAIHVAVVPAMACEDLLPGQRVGFKKAGEVGVVSNPIGIVDPFLSEPVKRYTRVWVLINPGTITSLRHEWTHPDIPEPESDYDYDDYDGCRGCD